MESLKRVANVELTTDGKKPRIEIANADSDQSDDSGSMHRPEEGPQGTEEDSLTEYEVGNLSPEVSNPFFSSNDSDEQHELNEIVELGAVVAAYSYEKELNELDDVDIGMLADTSVEVSTSPTSNSDVDPELPRMDFFYFETCNQCGTNTNENKYVPFCDKCYLKRKNFFPLRPKIRRRRRLLKTRSDSGIELPCSQDSVATEDVVDGPSRGGQKEQSPCEICLENTKNGMFAHGSTAHMYSCYKCAKKIWQQSGKCPLCRKKIDRVLRLI